MIALLLGSVSIAYAQGTVSPEDIAKFVSKQKASIVKSELCTDLLLHLTGPFNETNDLAQTAAILKGLGNNLILESTRGLKDIQVYQKASPFVVLIATDEGLGSGAVIDSEGHVLTNWHVVEKIPNAKVYFKPKDSATLKDWLGFNARVEKIDQTADLALLKIVTPPNINGFLELAKSPKIEVGQDVHAIGHPSGLIWTYTKGIVSQVRSGYKWKTKDNDLEHQADVVQTQTPINPGNSGGPLLNDDGQLIGINSFSSTGEGLNFAIAVDSIQEFLSRKDNRVATSSKPKEDINCSEPYYTQSKGQPDILGCYTHKDTPPPHFWFMPQESKDYPYTLAFDHGRKGKIDTVVVGKKDGARIWFFDRSCTGIVDLIGNQGPSSSDIDSYKAPTKVIRIDSLVPILELAIRNKKLPYPGLQFCK